MKIIKYMPFYLIFGTISILSAYKIMVVQKKIYDKYNGQIGKVEWVTFAPRSGIYLCGVRLPDGTYDEVNAGSYPFKVGDNYRNTMQYGYIMGLTGLAYTVEPDNNPSVVWGLCYLFLFVLPIIGLLFMWIIVKPIKWWMSKFSER